MRLLAYSSKNTPNQKKNQAKDKQKKKNIGQIRPGEKELKTGKNDHDFAPFQKIFTTKPIKR